MLPDKGQQEVKLQELMMISCSEVLPHAMDRKKFAKQYAKWYAEEVIKHCAIAAKTKEVDGGWQGQSTTYTVIDKQSILNVINEL